VNEFSGLGTKLLSVLHSVTSPTTCCGMNSFIISACAAEDFESFKRVILNTLLFNINEKLLVIHIARGYKGFISVSVWYPMILSSVFRQNVSMGIKNHYTQ
jgi:hypothetical protein